MRIHLTATLLFLAAPAVAVVAQDLQRPTGWNTRFDMDGAHDGGVETIVEMPPGWHVTTGPAGIYWSPEYEASGEFRAEMEVFLFDPKGMREGFGLILGGKNLDAPNQEYTYFLLRDGGQFIIKRREGASAPTLRPWTGHSSIRSYADRGEGSSVRNVLAVEAHSDKVRFFVNDAEVARIPRSEVDVNGIFGFRVNHNLSLHISTLEAVPLGSL